MKKFKTLFTVGCLALAMTACNKDTAPTTAADPATQEVQTTVADPTEEPQAPADTTAVKPEETKATEEAKPTEEVKVTEAPKETEAPKATKEAKEETAVITLADGGKTTVEGGAKDCVFLEGKAVIIQKPGNYELKGKLTDGQVRVEVTKEDKVEILFNGVDITNKNGAPFYAVSADKVIIELKKDTTNTLTDAQNYELEEGVDEPNACLFSKDDLTIKGKGALVVTGNYNNGIVTKDDLKISGGTITVKAKKNGIRGNESITIKDGTITVDAVKDGFKVSEEEDVEKGFFLMEGGTVVVDAGDDAIQAVTSVKIEDGTVTYRADGNDIKCDGTIEVKEGAMTEKTK